MLPFLAAMLALLIVALWRGKGRAAATTGILLANWLLQVAMIRATGEQFPWLFFIVTDYVAALVVYGVGGRRWSMAVIAIYVVQILCHAAYGLSSRSALVEWRYYWALTYTGWGQLLVVGGWLGHDVVRRWVGSLRGTPPAVADSGTVGTPQGEAKEP